MCLSFSNKNKTTKLDFSILGIDIHAHLLPGIDDGVQDIKESIETVEQFVNCGFTKLIQTPHFASDYFKNSNNKILSKLKVLQEAVKQHNIPVTIEAAAEYYFDYNFKEMVDQKEELLTFGNNYVLIEFSSSFLPEKFFDVFFTLQTNGYRPVLAHPERYGYFAADFNIYEKILDKGVLFQLSLNSLVDGYGKQVTKTSQEMIKHNMYSFAGSDCHGMYDFLLLKNVLSDKWFQKLVDSGRLLNKTL